MNVDSNSTVCVRACESCFNRAYGTSDMIFGVFEKRGVLNKSFKLRLFRLQVESQIVEYFKIGSFDLPRGQLDLNRSLVRQLTDTDGPHWERSFKIEQTLTGRTYIFRLASRAHKAKWMRLFITVHKNEKIEQLAVDFEKEAVVGRRIKLQTNKGSREGVIRYRGAVHFAMGDFIGVELDDAVGNHNGEHNGRTYFNCGTNRGLFSRIANVLAVLPDAKPESADSKAEISKAEKEYAPQVDTEQPDTSNTGTLCAQGSSGYLDPADIADDHEDSDRETDEEESKNERARALSSHHPILDLPAAAAANSASAEGTGNESSVSEPAQSEGETNSGKTSKPVTSQSVLFGTLV
eukprot:CAMPEP_0175157222 /NCGR_PEP_ID=MMETSP0087-20121206/22076_1 /TAXON_ID=136419 /ORGANISM="Unknown Unknown, Strain D1" /LENGTH=349 /DNA_ID=CAMNT_0016444795 /DNA_START=146 /DNA_END=1195 /DNA_ORIENTATION=-